MVLVTGGIAIAAIASLCCIMVWPIRIRYREWEWGQRGGVRHVAWITGSPVSCVSLG